MCGPRSTMSLVTFWLLLLVLASMCGVAECDCMLEGKERSVGETWHPTLFGKCVNCTCQLGPSGEPEVSCENKADNCPKPNCDEPKHDPNSCCPYCEVRAEDDKSSSSNRKSCTTDSGKEYKDGERYASNSTGLRPTSDNQCVMCVCQNGLPLCHLKTCYAPSTCSSFVDSDEDCCPVCTDIRDVSLESLGNHESRAVIEAIKDDNDCLTSGVIKKNGSTWHPWIASIGQIDCITCQCVNGKIKCKKDCIPDHELPCRHPKKSNGECCKTCLRKKKRRKDKGGGKDKNKKTGDKKDSRRRCKGKRKNKDKKRCKNRRKRRKGRTTPSLAPTVTSSPGVDLQNLCLRKKTKYLVYKAIGQTEMFMGFDDIEANMVVVYKWTVDKANKREVVSFVGESEEPAADFRRQINNTNVIGTTGRKQYRRFKRRLKDKLDRCTSGCEPELFIKILQRVNVHLLKFGEECNS